LFGTIAKPLAELLSSGNVSSLGTSNNTRVIQLAGQSQNTGETRGTDFLSRRAGVGAILSVLL